MVVGLVAHGDGDIIRMKVVVGAVASDSVDDDDVGEKWWR